MRRIRHLEQCDYIVPVGQKINQVLTLSNQSNCYLERTWDQKRRVEPFIFASFDSSAMQGIKVIATLRRGLQDAASVVENVALYRVADGSWLETFVFQKAPTMNGLSWSCSFSQSDLGANELSGAETYSVVVSFRRRREIYRAKCYFNHLGCFDSINRLRQEIERQQILGALE